MIDNIKSLHCVNDKIKRDRYVWLLYQGKYLIRFYQSYADTLTSLNMYSLVLNINGKFVIKHGLPYFEELKNNHVTFLHPIIASFDNKFLEKIESLSLSIVSRSKSIKVQKTYIMLNKDNRLYKIGKSICPKKRLSSLSNKRIKLIAIYNNDIEKELHKRFKDKRVTGEWFKLSQNDIILLKNDYDFVEYK